MYREITKTDIEQIMENALVSNNIKYSYQFPIRGSYILDFAIPDLKIDIECDGEFYHPKGNDYDRKRNWFLRNRGWTVLRFTGNQIKENIDDCIEKIKKEIKSKVM